MLVVHLLKPPVNFSTNFKVAICAIRFWLEKATWIHSIHKHPSSWLRSRLYEYDVDAETGLVAGHLVMMPGAISPANRTGPIPGHCDCGEPRPHTPPRHSDYRVHENTSQETQDPLCRGHSKLHQHLCDTHDHENSDHPTHSSRSQECYRGLGRMLMSGIRRIRWNDLGTM